MCFNCLGEMYVVKDCQSKSTCKTCKRSHYTLLHLDYKASSHGSSGAERRTNINHQRVEIKTVLLSTAVVRVKTIHGHHINSGAMLDSDAQLIMILNSCAVELGLHREPYDVTVNDINGSKYLQTATVDLQIQIKDRSYMNVKMLMMPKLTEMLPSE